MVRAIKQLLLMGAMLGSAVATRAATLNPESGADSPDEFKNVTVVEHAGSTLPLDTVFTDDAGKRTTLRPYFTGKKPVILQLGYFECPMLCNYVSRSALDAVKQVSLNAGTDYEFVFVSIDPRDTTTVAAQKKKSFLESYRRPGAETGWHLLTGDEQATRQLADAVGFQYKWVPAAQQFSHPAAIVVCMPDGRISRYLYGVKFDPQTVRLSLVEASNGKVGSVLDQFILTCYQYDGHQGKYAVAVLSIMRAGGVLTMIVVATVLIRLFRKEARERAAGIVSDH